MRAGGSIPRWTGCGLLHGRQACAGTGGLCRAGLPESPRTARLFSTSRAFAAITILRKTHARMRNGEWVISCIRTAARKGVFDLAAGCGSRFNPEQHRSFLNVRCLNSMRICANQLHNCENRRFRRVQKAARWGRNLTARGWEKLLSNPAGFEFSRPLGPSNQKRVLWVAGRIEGSC